MITGKHIYDAFNFVAKCSKEVEGLHELLANLLSEQLNEQRSALPCVPNSDVINDQSKDESGIVQVNWLHAVGLKSRARRTATTEMHLGYQISLMDSGCAIPGNQEPLLHVFCWQGRPSFSTDVYLGFPLNEDKDNPVQVLDDRLLTWATDYSREWCCRAWAYSLRLVQLNNPDDLRTHVTRPAIGLLCGQSAVQALPDTMPALVRYPAVEKLLLA